jgi:hypothetical protein
MTGKGENTTPSLEIFPKIPKKKKVSEKKKKKSLKFI